MKAKKELLRLFEVIDLAALAHQDSSVDTVGLRGGLVLFRDLAGTEDYLGD